MSFKIATQIYIVSGKGNLGRFYLSLDHRPFRKMATGRTHGATFRSRGADSERSRLICILRAADGSNF